MVQDIRNPHSDVCSTGRWVATEGQGIFPECLRVIRCEESAGKRTDYMLNCHVSSLLMGLSARAVTQVPELFFFVIHRVCVCVQINVFKLQLM